MGGFGHPTADAVSFACELSQVMGEGTGKKDRTKKDDNGHEFESPGDPSAISAICAILVDVRRFAVTKGI